MCQNYFYSVLVVVTIVANTASLSTNFKENDGNFIQLSEVKKSVDRLTNNEHLKLSKRSVSGTDHKTLNATQDIQNSIDNGSVGQGSTNNSETDTPLSITNNTNVKPTKENVTSSLSPEIVNSTVGSTSASTYASTIIKNETSTTPSNHTSGFSEASTNSSIEVTSSGVSNYFDETSFVGGLNEWDPEGELAKYDLSQLPEKLRLVPLNNASDDHNVIIFKISTHYPSSIKKSFSALENGMITLVYYVEFSKYFTLSGRITTKASKQTEPFFNFTIEQLEKVNKKWFEFDIPLPNTTKTEEFQIELLGSALEDGVVWAIDKIMVEDRDVTTTHSIITTGIVEPVINVTDSYENSTLTNEDSTSPSDINSIGKDNLHEVKMVARAIWEAFYVFLALFVACLIALIALIAKQRCRENNTPATVSTYNPRTSSYRVEGAHNNPAYDTNQV